MFRFETVFDEASCDVVSHTESAALSASSTLVGLILSVSLPERCQEVLFAFTFFESITLEK